MIEWIALHQATIMGIILMGVLGPAVGNYACSVVYRLPLGRTPFERHPYCGHCNADLQPRDLFPILSWLSTRGACRYCAGPIPSIYTAIELACLAVFVGYFLTFGVGEAFLLLASFAVFTIILAAIQWQQGWVSASIYGYAFTSVALLRTWADGTIYGWVQSAFITLVLCLLWQRIVTAIARTQFAPFDTPWIWWMTLIAALTPLGLLPLLVVPAFLLVVFRLLPTAVRPWVLVPVTALALYWPVALATMP